MNNQELVTQWNKQHALGSHVRMLRADKRPLDTTTNGMGIVELESLQVTEIRGKR